MLFFFDLAVFENHLTPKAEISSSFSMKIDFFPNKPLEPNFFLDLPPLVLSFQTIGWLLCPQVIKETIFSFDLLISLFLPTLKVENASSFSLKFNCISDKQGKTNFTPNTPMVYVLCYTIGGLLYLWVVVVLLPKSLYS